MTYKLSEQACGALLMTLQKCLSEQTDILELLKEWDIELKDNQVYVQNPPTFKASEPSFEVPE
tara:strand:- start:1274 stop:1462 length:189 start_codon:yes stop_codon:yes gene_type:complete